MGQCAGLRQDSTHRDGAHREGDHTLCSSARMELHTEAEAQGRIRRKRRRRRDNCAVHSTEQQCVDAPGLH